MNPEITVIPKGDTLTFLEGKALEQKHPVPLSIVGQIESVKRYLDARRGSELAAGSLQYVNKDLAVITIDEENMTITLDVDPNNPFGTEVIGKLLPNPELAHFQINKSGHRFTRESLLEIITFRRRFFADPSQFENLKASLQRMKISASTDITQDSDKRGYKDLAYKKVVDSANVPESFKLNMPIFKGQPAKTFLVDLCTDLTDAGARFFLESVELIELMEADKKAIIQAQLAGYLNFCIIWK